MRSLVRAVAPVAAALLIALVGASSTMAASPTNYRVAFDAHEIRVDFGLCASEPSFSEGLPIHPENVAEQELEERGSEQDPDADHQ